VDGSPKVRLTQHDLVNLLPSILTAAGDQSPFLSEKISEVVRFYSNKNPEYVENQTQRFLAIAKDNLSIAYSCRNRIVHNSNIEGSFLLYIVKSMHRLSGAFLRMLLLGLKGLGARTTDSMLVSLQFKINSLQSRLKAKKSVNLWEIRLDP
jgi:hypothetical protein